MKQFNPSSVKITSQTLTNNLKVPLKTANKLYYHKKILT